eukprot:8888431-Ditylum_brightwellii.AAC.1
MDILGSSWTLHCMQCYPQQHILQQLHPDELYWTQETWQQQDQMRKIGTTNSRSSLITIILSMTYSSKKFKIPLTIHINTKKGTNTPHTSLRPACSKRALENEKQESCNEDLGELQNMSPDDYAAIHEEEEILPRDTGCHQANAMANTTYVLEILAMVAETDKQTMENLVQTNKELAKAKKILTYYPTSLQENYTCPTELISKLSQNSNVSNRETGITGGNR